MISEGSPTSKAPPVSPEDAARLAQELYDFGSMTPVSALALPGEYDSNFKLMLGDGRRFVLKVMHPARDRGLVDLQCSALSHLKAVAPELNLSRVHPTRTGDLVTLVSMPAPAGNASLRLVWMLSFVEGVPLLMPVVEDLRDIAKHTGIPFE